MDDKVVFATPWFELVAKRPPGYSQPHYSIRTQDYVLVVATTVEGCLVLVRQFRPAVGETTLEFPSGHVERGETPLEAAQRELLEETGHVASTLELMGNLSPDTGRLGNRLWCFYAAAASRTSGNGYEPEPGVELVLYDRSLKELLDEADFFSALNHAAVLLALAGGRLSISS
jgi:ADP-ribose pyrophosphatase